MDRGKGRALKLWGLSGWGDGSEEGDYGRKYPEGKGKAGPSHLPAAAAGYSPHPPLCHCRPLMMRSPPPPPFPPLPLRRRQPLQLLQQRQLPSAAWRGSPGRRRSPGTRRPPP